MLNSLSTVLSRLPRVPDIVVLFAITSRYHTSCQARELGGDDADLEATSLMHAPLEVLRVRGSSWFIFSGLMPSVWWVVSFFIWSTKGFCSGLWFWSLNVCCSRGGSLNNVSCLDAMKRSILRPMDSRASSPRVPAWWDSLFSYRFHVSVMYRLLNDPFRSCGGRVWRTHSCWPSSRVLLESLLYFEHYLALFLFTLLCCGTIIFYMES